MIGHLQKRFPQAQVMFKPAHIRAGNKHAENPSGITTGSADLGIMNESTRILAKKLGIPVLECESMHSKSV